MVLTTVLKMTTRAVHYLTDVLDKQYWKCLWQKSMRMVLDNSIEKIFWDWSLTAVLIVSMTTVLCICLLKVNACDRETGLCFPARKRNYWDNILFSSRLSFLLHFACIYITIAILLVYFVISCLPSFSIKGPNEQSAQYTSLHSTCFLFLTNKIKGDFTCCFINDHSHVNSSWLKSLILIQTFWIITNIASRHWWKFAILKQVVDICWLQFLNR